MHDSSAVANRLLDLAREKGRALTPMQLLKLVYIAHGWMLGLYGRPLVRDEVEAWQYGPVIPRLYNRVRQYRSGSITAPLPVPPDEVLDDEERSVVDQVFEIYGGMTGPALSRITHASGTPWARTYREGQFGIGIPTDLIADHYRHLAETRPDRLA